MLGYIGTHDVANDQSRLNRVRFGLRQIAQNSPQDMVLRLCPVSTEYFGVIDSLLPNY